MTDAAWTVASAAGEVRLRPEHAGDEAFRFALFRQSRPDDWSASGLDLSVLDGVMRHQFRAQTIGYRTQFPGAAFDILEHGGERIGRIVVDRPGDRIHIVDHAIMPSWRNRGFGTAVIRALMAEAAEAAVMVRLKVASGNDPSLRLYARLGFTVAGKTAAYLDMAWRARP